MMQLFLLIAELCQLQHIKLDQVLAASVRQDRALASLQYISHLLSKADTG